MAAVYTFGRAFFFEMGHRRDVAVADRDGGGPAWARAAPGAVTAMTMRRARKAAERPAAVTLPQMAGADDDDDDGWPANETPTQVAAGCHFSACVTDAGRLYLWGTLCERAMRRPTRVRLPPSPPGSPLARRVVTVACGRKHAVALATTREVFTWGSGMLGRLGHGDNASCAAPRRVDALCYDAPASRVRRPANEQQGQAGSEGPAASGAVAAAPNEVAARLDARIRAVFCGGSHSCAVTMGGRAFFWGFNRYGQCGCRSFQPRAHAPTAGGRGSPRARNAVLASSAGRVGDAQQVPLPTALQWDEPRRDRDKDKGISSKAPVDPPKVAFVACGRQHTALVDAAGGLYTWGAGSHGRLGHPRLARSCLTRPTPVAAFAGLPVAQVACGDWHSVALAADGDVYTWGYGADGQLGHGNLLHRRLPGRVAALKGARVAGVDAGAWRTLCVTEGGALLSFGQPGDGAQGDARPRKAHSVPRAAPGFGGHLSDASVRQASAGGGHVVLLAGDDAFDAMIF